SVHRKAIAAIEKCLGEERDRLEEKRRDLERWKKEIKGESLRRCSVDDVYRIFQHMGLPVAYGILESKRINGDMFCKLLEEDFPALLQIHLLGDIKRVVNLRRLLLNKQDIPVARSATAEERDRGNVLEWTVDDVCTWLGKNGLAK